jgi:hypothetical protein
MLHELHRIEREIDKEIGDAINGGNWDEDYITRRILLCLKSLQPPINYGHKSAQRITWSAYKQVPPLETNYGDIGFVVDITFPNRRKIRGIAFLEAKRIYSKSASYTKLGNWKQIGKMLGYTQHHHLLLYDQKPQKVEFLHLPRYIFEGLGCTTRAVVVPSQYAFAARVKSRQLHEYGFSLTEQIYCRYFRGLDLDFRITADEKLLAKVIAELKFVVTAAISLGGEHESSSIDEMKMLMPRGFTEITLTEDNAT